MMNFLRLGAKHTWPLSLALAGLAVLAAESGDWPRWRGQNFDDHASASQVFERGYGLKTLWQRALGSGYSPPVVAQGVLVAAYASEDQDYVAGLKADSGETLWSFPIGPTFKGKDGAVDGPLSSPLIDGDFLYFLGPHGDLLCLGLKDGKLVWRKQLVQDFGAFLPQWGFTTSPLVYKHLLVVAAGATGNKGVLALNKASGDLVWGSEAENIHYQSPLLAKLAGYTQLVVAGDNRILGLDPDTGATLWQYSHGGFDMYAQILSPVIVGDDRIFFKHHRFFSQMLQIRRADDGGFQVEKLWESGHFKRNYTLPLAEADRLYGYSGKELACLDADDGKLKWKSGLFGEGFLLMVEGHLAVLTNKGALHVGAVSPQGYREMGNTQLFENEVWTPPIFAQGHFFARDTKSMFAAVAVVPNGEGQPIQEAEGQTAFMRPVKPSAKSPFLTFISDLQRVHDEQPVIDAFLAEHPTSPIIERDKVVHLIYRGDARRVVVESDVFDAGGWQAMVKVKGTDLFTTNLRVAKDASFSYRFVVDMDKRMADPRNPNSYTDKNGEAWSLCVMPRYRGPRVLPDAVPHKAGTLKTHAFKDAGSGLEIGLSVYLPHDYAGSEARYPTLYVVNGREMLQDGGMVRWLDQLIPEQVAPLMVVFLSVERPESLDGSRENRLAAALLNGVVPFVDEQYRTQAVSHQRSLYGSGEVGYAALDFAFAHADVFGKVLAQSATPFEVEDKRLVARLDQLEAGAVEVYLDWGLYDLRDQNRNLDVQGFNLQLKGDIETRGLTFRGGRFPNGQGIGAWRMRLEGLLKAMYPNLVP